MTVTLIHLKRADGWGLTCDGCGLVWLRGTDWAKPPDSSECPACTLRVLMDRIAQLEAKESGRGML